MGYEIKMLVGKSSFVMPEYKQDTANPFDDGSGFPDLKDENGKPIGTGHNQSFFQIYAQVDLCKLGYQEDALNTLIASSHQSKKPQTFHYFWLGESEINQDRYGAYMTPVSAKAVLDAINQLSEEQMQYRRLKWAKSLLESMVSDSEEIQVLFYGY